MNSGNYTLRDSKNERIVYEKIESTKNLKKSDTVQKPSISMNNIKNNVYKKTKSNNSLNTNNKLSMSTNFGSKVKERDLSSNILQKKNARPRSHIKNNSLNISVESTKVLYEKFISPNQKPVKPINSKKVVNSTINQESLLNDSVSKILNRVAKEDHYADQLRTSTNISKIDQEDKKNKI